MTQDVPTLFVISTKTNALIYPKVGTSSLSPQQRQNTKEKDENPFFQARNTAVIPLACDNSLLVQSSSLLSLLLTLNTLNNSGFYMKLEIKREFLENSKTRDAHPEHHNQIQTPSPQVDDSTVRNSSLNNLATFTIIVYNWNEHLYAFIVKKFHPKHNVLLRQIISFQQYFLVNKELKLDSFSCQNLAKYMVIDVFMVRKCTETGSHTIYSEQLDRLSDPLQSSGACTDTVSFLFDILGEYTIDKLHSTNYILHRTSEFFAVLVACCRYCMRHRNITRSVVKLLHNVYIGIIWLPLYSPVKFAMSQPYILMLFKEKSNHFDQFNFEEIHLSTSELFTFNHTPILHSSPLVSVSWCTNPNIFTQDQQYEMNTFVSKLIPSTSKPPDSRLKVPQRRFILPPTSPLTNISPKQSNSSGTQLLTSNNDHYNRQHLQSTSPSNIKADKAKPVHSFRLKALTKADYQLSNSIENDVETTPSSSKRRVSEESNLVKSTNLSTNKSPSTPLNPAPPVAIPARRGNFRRFRNSPNAYADDPTNQEFFPPPQ